MSVLTPGIHPLLTQDVLEKLNRRNIFTVQQFIDVDLKQLSTFSNLTYKNVLIIRKHILNKNSAVIRRGDEYYKELIRRIALISTGINGLDKILDGGFYTGNIYEICSLPCSGKTQLCYTILTKYVKTYKQNILYIDTKYDFSPSRLQQILGTSDFEVTLKNILIQQISTPHELINSLYDIKDNLERNLRLRMIIVDSLPALIYQKESHEEGNLVLNCLVNVMRRLAVEYHIVFLVTNNVTTWMESIDFGDKMGVEEKIGCGKYWRTVPNTRLRICRRSHELPCEISVIKSSQVKEGLKCSVKLDENGISDYE